MFSKKLTSNLKAKDILDSEVLTQREDGDSSLFRRSGLVLAALNNFLNSSDGEVNIENVPTTWRVGNDEVERALSIVDRQNILEDTCTQYSTVFRVQKKNFECPA